MLYVGLQCVRYNPKNFSNKVYFILPQIRELLDPTNIF